jgi:hypothetical protein
MRRECSYLTERKRQKGRVDYIMSSSVISTFLQMLFGGDEIKKDEMGGTSNTHA